MTDKQHEDTYEILSRYSDQKPQTAEKRYPVSAVVKMMIDYNELVNDLSLQNVSSCYAVFDEEDNIVQLYQTEEKANKGLWEFQNSHPHTEFYVDTMHIN